MKTTQCSRKTKSAPKHCRVGFVLTQEQWAELERQSSNAWMSKTRYAKRALCAVLAQTRAQEAKLKKQRKLETAFAEVYAGMEAEA